MKIICVGRNYAAHAAELGNEKPTAPVLFLKPDTALAKDNAPFYIPDFSNEIHHEVEVVLKVGKEGKNIQEKFAHLYVDSVGLGIDFTARDLQAQLKAKGLPWEISKAFNNSAVVGEFHPIPDLFEEGKVLNFHLNVNGEMRQKGNTDLMLFSFREIIAYASKFFTLKKGDLIFTGTPEGVAKVQPNDELEGFLEGKSYFRFNVK